MNLSFAGDMWSYMCLFTELYLDVIPLNQCPASLVLAQGHLFQGSKSWRKCLLTSLSTTEGTKVPGERVGRSGWYLDYYITRGDNSWYDQDRTADLTPVQPSGITYYPLCLEDFPISLRVV